MGQVVSPIRDVGVLAQQGTALALGQPAPNTELDAIIQGVGAAFGQHRAVAANDGRLALFCTAHKEGIRVTLAAFGLGDVYKRQVLDIPAVFTRTVMGECAPSQTEYYVTHLSLFIQVEDCLTRHTLGGASDLPPTEGDHVVYGA